VRNHSETTQSGRLELLKDHSVGNDVLNIVGHHGRNTAGKETPESRVTQSYKGFFGNGSSV